MTHEEPIKYWQASGKLKYLLKIEIDAADKEQAFLDT